MVLQVIIHHVDSEPQMLIFLQILISISIFSKMPLSIILRKCQYSNIQYHMAFDVSDTP